MITKLQFHLLAVLSLLLPALTSKAVQTVPATPVASTGLLQFTSGGHVLGFAADGMVAATGSHALHVSFLGANNIQPLADASAHDKSQAASLERVAYTDLWDGVSLTYTASPGNIYRTTYTLAPGANANNIRLRYNAPLTLKEDGTLHIAFENGAMTESAPIAWQEIHGKHVDVDVSFRLRGQEVSFVLGKYDPHHALVIDPSLIWNTFLGGTGVDYGYGIAMDGTSHPYVVGESGMSWGCSLPCTTARSFTGSGDAFAAKLGSDGAMIWRRCTTCGRPRSPVRPI